MKIIVSQNKDFVWEIRKALDDNDGYCPCSLMKSEDTKCMCKEFRESMALGPCHCGLYERVEANE